MVVGGGGVGKSALTIQFIQVDSRVSSVRFQIQAAFLIALKMGAS